MNTTLPSYGVTELTRRIKRSLEEGFSPLRVRGEISTFRPASSGHCYFNLKDRESVISCVLFRRQREALSFSPREGQEVLVLGRLTVYPQRGNYQIICETLEEAGQGEVLYQLQRLKQRLQEEGLFDQERKQPLPPYPRTIGVVTSRKAAALQDILQVLGRRIPAFRLVLADALVQGEASAPSLCRALAYLDSREDVEVIILARGGGSLEDLLSFSNEALLRQIGACTTPVITGIGHEIDFTLADFVADCRAPTPSAAAEIISQAFGILPQQLGFLRQSLEQAMEQRLQRLRYRLEGFSASSLKERLIQSLGMRQQRVDNTLREVQNRMGGDLMAYRHRLDLAKELLQVASPQALLDRGFVIVYKGKKSIHSAGDLRGGDRIELHFSDGLKGAIVEED